MFKKLIALTLTVLMVFVVMTGCTKNNNSTDNNNDMTDENPNNEASEVVYKDGTYRAKMEDYNKDGWQDYVEIVIDKGIIKSVEYQSLNQEGLKITEDTTFNDTMKDMYGMTGTEIYSGYSESLLNGGNIESVTEINGTTDSFNYFMELAKAALEQAKKGDTTVVTVPLPLNNNNTKNQ